MTFLPSLSTKSTVPTTTIILTALRLELSVKRHFSSYYTMQSLKVIRRMRTDAVMKVTASVYGGEKEIKGNFGKGL